MTTKICKCSAFAILLVLVFTFSEIKNMNSRIGSYYKASLASYQKQQKFLL